MGYRTILFRAKMATVQKLNALATPEKVAPDGWVKGYYSPDASDDIFGDTKHNPSIIKTGNPKDIYTGMWINVDEETVGQYVGINDDCGDKIFEGDIVEVLYDGQIYYGVIEWQPAEARFLIYIKDAADWIPLDDQSVHIVGNIYDNPELLEV